MLAWFPRAAAVRVSPQCEIDSLTYIEQNVAEGTERPLGTCGQSVPLNDEMH